MRVAEQNVVYHPLPQPALPGKALNIQGARLDNQGQFDGAWLNEQELIKATNELHLMYLHATDKVMKDDNLLALFDIPKILWPRLRLSWQLRVTRKGG